MNKYTKNWFRPAPATVLALATLALMLSGCTRDPHVKAQKYVRNGEKYFAEGQYSAASIEFRNALKSDPQSAIAAYRLGTTELALQNWPAAYTSLKQAVAINPGYGEAQLALAELLLSARQPEPAQQAIAAVLAGDAKNVNALLLRSRADVAEQRTADAKADLEQARKLFPADARVLTGIADIALFEHRPGDAVSGYQSAVKADPKFFIAYLHLAQAYLGERDIASAEAALNGGIAQNPQVTPLYLGLAGLEIRQGKAAETDAVLERLRATEGNAAAKLFAIGDFYVRFGELEKGKNALNQALQKDARYEPARRELIEVDLSTGDLASVDTLIGQILKQRPKDPEGRLYQSRLMLARHDYSKAQEILENLVHDVPEMARAHLALGLTYAAEGDPARATASMQRAVARDPDLLGAYYGLAQIALRQNDGRLALTSIDEILRRNPTLAAAHMLRGNALLALNQLQGALDEFQPIAAAQPHGSEAQERVGFTYLRMSQYPKAEQALETALSADAANGGAMRDLVVVYQMQHRPAAKIIARLQQQIQASPQPEYFELLGGAYISDHQPALAEAALRTAVEKNPKAVSAQLELAQLHMAEQKYNDALIDAQHALQANSEYLPAYMIVGEAEDRLGDYRKAQQAYEDLLKKAPNTPAALNNLAWLYSEHDGNLDMALDMAQRAKQGMPDNPSVTDTLAWIQYRKGLASIAVNDFSDLVRQAPDNPTYRFHLGMALLKLGRDAEARAALQRALSLNLPASLADQARTALAQLGAKTG